MCRSWFDSREFPVGFGLEKMAQGQVFPVNYCVMDVPYSFTHLSSAVGTIGALTTAVPRDSVSPHLKKKQRYPKKMVP
jgi:hypothetical protein